MNRWLFLALTLAPCLLPGQPVRAEEPAKQFVEALRGRGYHDLALEYLDRLDTSPLCPPEFKEQLTYEKALTLFDSVKSERDPDVQLDLLHQSRRLFEEFVDRQPSHELAEKARTSLGGVVLVLAEAHLKRGERSASKSERKQEFDNAAKLFAKARELYLRRKQELAKQLSASRAQGAAKPGDDIKRLRIEYIQVQLKAAETLYRSSATFIDQPSVRERALREAAQEYTSIAEKYGGYRYQFYGFTAKLAIGRCNQELGKCKEALPYFEEILEQEATGEAFRVLQTQALLHAMQCWSDASIKKVDLAINKANAWEEARNPRVDKDPRALEVRWLLAQLAYKESKSETAKAEKVRMAGIARKQAQIVARSPGPDTGAAQQLLAQLGTSQPTSASADRPKTFTEALEAGRAAMEEMSTASLAMNHLRRSLDSDENNPDLRKQLEETEGLIEEQRAHALDLHRLALELADKTIPEEEMNVVRAGLCYLHYFNQDYFRAALLGQFVAQNFPNFDQARQCARIAMASFIKLYYEEPDASSRDFESRHIIEIADFIAKMWPNEPEAQEALVALVDFMVGQGQLTRAQEYLSNMPEDSNQRALAEIKVATGLWSQLSNAGNGEASDVEATSARMEKVKSVEALMTGALSRIKPESVNYAALVGILSLSQLYLEDGRAGEALNLLRDQATGPLTLVEKGDVRSQSRGFAEQTYQVALRATIAALPSAANPQAALNEARQLMQSLSKTLGNQPDAKRRLLAIYYSVANDLKKQMQAESDQARVALAQGFETFLDGLVEEASDVATLNWAAQSFLGMAEEFEGSEPALTKSFGKKAAAVYQGLLDQISAGAIKGSPSLTTQVKLRLAAALGQSGELQAAIGRYGEVLAKNPMLLSVQIDAAKAYQAGKDYDKAIRGGIYDRRTKANTIWGWGRIAQITKRYLGRDAESREKYEPTFHEASYNMAVCQYLKSRDLPQDERNEQLRRAMSAIARIHATYPDMGSQSWKEKYDRLLKRIQRDIGQSPKGLAALD